MIREAGFEIEGNPVSAGETDGGGFRLRGEAALLRPEVART
jgi:hypothetical protein